MDPDGDAKCRDLSTISSLDQENLLVVIHNRSADSWLEDWRREVGELPANFGVISIGGFTRSEALQSFPSDSGQGLKTQIETVPEVETIPNIIDLMEIGVTINRYIDSWEGNGKQTVVCFNCLTELMEEVDQETAFKFLHLLTSRLGSADAVAHFHLDPEVPDVTDIKTIEWLFDSTIEV